MKNLLILGILALAGFTYMRNSHHEGGLEHERIQTISTGEEITIAEHLDDGWTVIEFGADW